MKIRVFRTLVFGVHRTPTAALVRARGAARSRRDGRGMNRPLPSFPIIVAPGGDEIVSMLVFAVSMYRQEPQSL